MYHVIENPNQKHFDAKKKSGRLIDKYHALSMHYFFVLNSLNKKRELKEYNDKSPKYATQLGFWPLIRTTIVDIM